MISGRACGSWPSRTQAAAQRASVAVERRRAAEPLVHQLNVIIATRGLAQLNAPPMTCPECGAAIAFNDFPERYFLFLSV